MAKRWSEDHSRKLVEGASANSLAWLRRQVGRSYDDGDTRSRAAIYARARRTWGTGGLRRGVFCYRQLAEMSGYSVPALRRAGAALGHRYRRLTRRGAYLITHEQREDIFAWLKNDYWSKARGRYTCVWCDLNKKPHKALGLCQTCWWRHRRLCDKIGVGAQPESQRVRLASITDASDLELAERHLVKGWALPKQILTQLARAPAS